MFGCVCLQMTCSCAVQRRAYKLREHYQSIGDDENEFGMISVECVAFLSQKKQQKERRELLIRKSDRNSEGTW